MTRRVVPMVVCSVALGMVLGCSGDWQRRPTGSEITEGTPSAVTGRLQYRLAVEGLPAGGRWKSTPVVADLNGDGIPDLAVHPRLEKGTRAWLGAGNGRWTDSSRGFLTEGTCGGAIQAGPGLGQGQRAMQGLARCADPIDQTQLQQPRGG